MGSNFLSVAFRNWGQGSIFYLSLRLKILEILLLLESHVLPLPASPVLMVLTMLGRDPSGIMDLIFNLP